MHSRQILRYFATAGLLYLAANANAASDGNYQYIVNPNMMSDTGNTRYFQADADWGAHGYWLLDGTANKILAGKTGLWETLNTDQFTVNDILDVTYTQDLGAYDVAYLRTTVGNFQYITGVNIVATMANTRYYQADPSWGAHGYWLLDGSANKMLDGKTGLWETLNTDLFTVNDILDVTYTEDLGDHDVAYLRTTVGNFEYITGVNIVANMGNTRFYQGDPTAGTHGYWLLDGTANQMLDGKTGLWTTPTLFNVNDIQDITYVRNEQPLTDFVYLTVAAPVPEPAAWALLLSGVAALRVAMRRQHRGVQVVG